MMFGYLDIWKIMFGIIKRTFIVLLASIAYASNHTKRVSLSNQQCWIKPTVINLHPNKYSQEFHYCQFAVILDRCLEVVILRMIYLIKCGFQIKQKI